MTQRAPKLSSVNAGGTGPKIKLISVVTAGNPYNPNPKRFLTCGKTRRGREMYERPRPDGFDYSKPDPIEDRCRNCNSDGLCRTGSRSLYPVGTCTTVWRAIKCEKNCNHGLLAKEEGL